MLDEYTASGSLFKSINLQQRPSTIPPPPNKSKLEENFIISYSLVYNNILFRIDIDMTLMSIFI